MNKSAVIGFFVGVAVLAGGVMLYGGGGKTGTVQVGAKTNPASGVNRAPAAEESAEIDGAPKTPEKKVETFKPGGNAPVAKVESKVAGLTMARSVTPGGYRAGQVLDVIVSLGFEGSDKVTALALVERLPKGWTFQEVSGGAKPVIAPEKGATGELTFVWVQVPAFPCTVSYRIVPGAEASGPQELLGQAVYRQLGPEQRTEMLKTVVGPAKT